MTRSPPWAYGPCDSHVFDATAFDVDPWSHAHRQAGPPSGMGWRALERAAAAEDLTHVGGLTGRLLRPVPVGEMRVEVAADCVGRIAAHARRAVPPRLAYAVT